MSFPPPIEITEGNPFFWFFLSQTENKIVNKAQLSDGWRFDKRIGRRALIPEEVCLESRVLPSSYA